MSPSEISLKILWPCTRLTQPEPAFCEQAEWVPVESWGSKHTHRVIHQPVSVVLQCGATVLVSG